MEISYQSPYKNISNEEWVKLQYELSIPQYVEQMIQNKMNLNPEPRAKQNKVFTFNKKIFYEPDEILAEQLKVFSELKEEFEFFKIIQAVEEVFYVSENF